MTASTATGRAASLPACCCQSQRHRPGMPGTAHLILLSLSLLLLCQPPPVASRTLYERDRVEEYHRRNHTWPLSHYVPETPGWRELLSRRFEQVERIPANDEFKYKAWVAVMTSAFTAPNFTENGWGLTRAPAPLVEELKASLRAGLGGSSSSGSASGTAAGGGTAAAAARPEHPVPIIEGTGHSRPLYIPQDELNAKVLEELRPIHEKWAGIRLEGSVAYGLRVYRNDSNLLMHVDDSYSHIIGSVLHVDHSDDGEPWPIIIEDFMGNTNEVIMESGDLLLYESSKCYHGRPKNFTGSWYSSIFVHYHPAVGWDQDGRYMDKHYAVPPHWKTAKPANPEDGIPRVSTGGTGIKEPDCVDNWCALDGGTVKWHGPARDGMIISTGYEDGRPLESFGVKVVAGDEL